MTHGDRMFENLRGVISDSDAKILEWDWNDLKKSEKFTTLERSSPLWEDFSRIETIIKEDGGCLKRYNELKTRMNEFKWSL